MNNIEVSNVKFKYPQRDVYAVDNVSFSIEEGSYTAIVGFNGSGKSTLAKIMCGLETAESGSVTIPEQKILGVVFQSPKNQIVSGIVSRDTAFGPQNLKLPSTEIELRTIESLNIVDLLHKAKASTNSLSLGQTQKVALSGVIALNPHILLMDEATSMLDPVSRSEILDFVKYWHQKGNTIIQITHDLEIVKQATAVIGMENGRVFFDGTAEEFLASEENVYRITGDPLPKSNRKEFNQKKNKQTVLSLQNVSFSYDESNSVNNISFNLYKGSLTALTGPSGAGKSTILELCSGLLKKSEGEICGTEGILAQQNASAALFETFAADDVAFGPANCGKKGKELLEIVKKAMQQAGIPYEEFGNRQTFRLSGGEQRRLSIAGILAMNKDVILFDEPTAGLDSKARTVIMNMLRALADEGKTVLFSTHKRDEADFSDREIYIEKGCIISDSYSEENSEEKLDEIKLSSSLDLISSLRKASSTISGENRIKKSVLQKIPSALRIVLFLLLFVTSILVRNIYWGIGVFLISFAYCKICGSSIKSLISVGIKILPFLLFFSLFQLIFGRPLPEETLYINLKWFSVSKSKLLFCGVSILRTYAAFACITGFFVSTPEYDLIDGLKVLLKPLELIKIPVRYFILILEIIFRFVPLLIEESCSILKTQVLRGGLKEVKGRMSKIKAVVPLIVPIIIQTIKRSEALADAITMRYFK